MSTQPEALRLAEIFEQTNQLYPNADVCGYEVINELRRLHAENEALARVIAARETIQQAEPVAQAWLWRYADGDWHDQPFGTRDECEREACGYDGEAHPLYTHPAPQPLTEEEIRAWWSSENGLEDCVMSKLDDFSKTVRAVEARIKGAESMGAT